MYWLVSDLKLIVFVVEILGKFPIELRVRYSRGSQVVRNVFGRTAADVDGWGRSPASTFKDQCHENNAVSSPVTEPLDIKYL